MSLASIIGDVVNILIKGSGAAASVASSAGVTSIALSGKTVSITALITELNTLANAAPGDALISSVHFTSVKDFLESQQFETDLVDLADLLGVIGLFVPAVAVAANDIRTIAMALTVGRALITGMIGMGVFSNLVADGRGGFVSQAWASDPREQLNPDGSFKN